jgi:hypothetical protein
VNRIDIYRQAIKRTFADLYGVSPDTVVKCAGKRFIHLVFSDSDDNAPEFHCPDEDPVVVSLTEDERNQLERAS